MSCGGDFMQNKTKQQLVDDLLELRMDVSELSTSEIRQRMAEKELKMENSIASSIFDIVGALIIVMDAKGRIKQFNRTCEKITGYSFEEVKGLSFWELFISPGETEEIKEAFKELQAGEPSNEFESYCITKEGSPRLISWSNSIIHQDGGEIESIIGTGIDITRRKEAEEALQTKVEELSRSNAELEQFAYVASHDLQEPLRMVTSFVQLLARRYKGKLDDDADEFIHFAVDGANRMKELINDVLTYSRVGSKKKEFKPTDCKVILEQVLINIRLFIKERGAVITYDDLPTVLADSFECIQLFQNLITNAIKFHSEKQPQVHIGVERRGDEWVFSVRDNGIGIHSEYFERVFFIFQRLHGRDKYLGTGIGLAICKKIVERHGGRIWLESEPGNGATFYFTLPYRTGDDLE
ncbi:MAG: sensory transduction histidine kinase [Bacilli bacterium]|nr:sensory transduction histidine kinase [Bacilli bacterium]